MRNPHIVEIIWVVEKKSKKHARFFHVFNMIAEYQATSKLETKENTVLKYLRKKSGLAIVFLKHISQYITEKSLQSKL